MDRVIDGRFDRVEKALDTLIKSIATYNPTPAHAEDLVAADAELSQGLELLTTHQANYAKILSLRATTDALDSQIRDTLALLVSTRKDLLATASSSTPPNINPVSYSELLSYARRISKFTLPPTHREAAPSPNPDSAEAGTGTPREAASQTHTNGNTTPVAATNGVDLQTQLSTAMDIDTVQTATPAGAGLPDSQATAIATNNNIWTGYLNPSADIPWTPWPSEDVIRRGALASIQVLLDQGVDPATFDPERSAELEEERKRKVEAEDMEREQHRAIMEEERRQNMEQRQSIAPGRQEEKRPKVFQLEDFEDDDED